MVDKGTHSYLSDIRNEKIQIFINGELYPRQEASISVFDSGFLLGDGVWEGIRLLNDHMVFLEEHLERLYYGAEKLAIDIGHTKEELTRFIQETLDANNMETGVHIRLIISRGLKKTPYQHPNANVGGSSVVIIPEYKAADEKINKKGIRLITVNTRRGTSDSQDPRLNTLSKHNCISACIEADRAGVDEGIMLDVNGNVSTCNSTNFFIFREREIWTSTGEFCLPGVTRQAVINLCRGNKISIEEKDFSITDVHSANEAFVTGTFAGIIPAVEIDGQIISGGVRGEITHMLQDLYRDKLDQLYPRKN